MVFLQSGQNQVGFENFNEEFPKERGEEKNFISESSIMQKLHNKIRELAQTADPVLILGSSGTGRTRVALEIFGQSFSQPDFKNFIQFSCEGLDEIAIEKKLFGNNEEPGLFKSGINKTLLIKGLDKWSLSLQGKFLSFFLGYESKHNLPRLIFSSGEEISEKVKDSLFARELFEILSQNLLILPRLSERKEDIPVLVDMFNMKNDFKGCINQEAMSVLQSHSWKGNLIELQNVCLQISILYGGKEVVTGEDVLKIIGQTQKAEKNQISYDPSLSLEELINCYIQLSLNHFQSKKKSADALGISVKTIYNKIKNGYIVYSD